MPEQETTTIHYTVIAIAVQSGYHTRKQVAQLLEGFLTYDQVQDGLTVMVDAGYLMVRRVMMHNRYSQTPYYYTYKLAPAYKAKLISLLLPRWYQIAAELTLLMSLKDTP